MSGKTNAAVVGLCLLWFIAAVFATETEHQGFSIVPSPGSVRIDGAVDDWDLTGSVFICGDVETFRDQYALWFSAMWDERNLYVSARWVDSTPMNNPGSTAGDMGFKGDSLQFRTITGRGATEKVAHFTCWAGSDGRNLVQITYGRDFKAGDVRDAQQLGAQQAFAVLPDHTGYTQEIAIPWSLLTADGNPPSSDEMAMTVEANFTTPTGRLTIKDLFRPNIPGGPDRIFTFRAYSHWSPATLESLGHLPLRPVRLTDGREFPVALIGGRPQVDWTGLTGNDPPRGFLPIAYHMPTGGCVSMVIRDAQGKIVRQLLTQSAQTKGDHRVMWDGLTSDAAAEPGRSGPPAPAGDYQWQAIALPDPGVQLSLRGWALSGGNLPWDGADGRGAWGGDHGEPSGVDADAQGVYLGWAGAEAGKALLKVDMQGKVCWRQTRGGMGGAGSVTVLDGIVYALDHGSTLYRVSAADGMYSPWDGRQVADLDVIALVADEPAHPKQATSLAATAGRLFVAYRQANLIAVLNAKTGELESRWTVDQPVDMKAVGADLYVISAGNRVLAIDVTSGRSRTVIEGLADARAVAIDSAGGVFVAVGGTVQRIERFDASGRMIGAIGREGGRAMHGPWTSDSVRNVNTMALDARGCLWATEAGQTPKRVSVWNVADGSLVGEYFGAAHYGASGGAIDPLDPDVMVGEGCEWRIDPATGHAKITGTIEQRIAGCARFNIGPNGELYLTTFHRYPEKDGKAGAGGCDFRVYQRLGEGDYRLRAEFDLTRGQLWSDLNGDGERQVEEIQSTPDGLVFCGYYGWSNGMADDMSVMGLMKGRGAVRLPIASFSASGAPVWDVAKLEHLPLPADCGFPYPSSDGKLALVMGGKAFGECWACVDAASGEVLWRYPDPFAGVHGSHRAPPGRPGLIRGAFGVIGTGKLPDPVGRYWIINTNKGEWHILNEHGFYLTRLFQGDLLKARWPATAKPGVLLNNVPSGSGEEDFGGSAVQLPDGRIFLQSGKMALWNVQLTGLENVRRIGGGIVSVTDSDVARAKEIRADQLQRAVGTQRLTVMRGSPRFTGQLSADFAGMAQVRFGAQEHPAAAAISWDDERLYLGYSVKDATPWVNGADAPQYLYSRGDTVDFQIGTDERANPARTAAVAGDMRVSIGNFKDSDKPTVVIYREVDAEKHPMTFSSGVVHAFVVDHVQVIDDADVQVHRNRSGYTVEAALPWSELRFKPAAGAKLRGDFGVTFGNATGIRTGLRSYWNNQRTGLVSDEVFELKLDPSLWGELTFQP